MAKKEKKAARKAGKKEKENQKNQKRGATVAEEIRTASYAEDHSTFGKFARVTDAAVLSGFLDDTPTPTHTTATASFTATPSIGTLCAEKKKIVDQFAGFENAVNEGFCGKSSPGSPFGDLNSQQHPAGREDIGGGIGYNSLNRSFD